MTRALILGAGRGSRMGALTEDRPKCMVELAGKPLVAWQCAALRAAGLDRIAMVRGYQGDRIHAPDVTFIDNARWAQSNMVVSLLSASDWIGNESFVVSYADIIYGPESVRPLLDSSRDIAITYDPHWLDLWARRFADPLDDAETFQADNNGRLVEIGQKPHSLDRVQGQYMGLLRFTPAGWQKVLAFVGNLTAAETDRLDMTSLLAGLLEAGVPIGAVPVYGGWAEVDSADDAGLYEQMLADGSLNIR